MRRPWMKALQRSSTSFMARRFGRRARESMIRQNRFARRYGLPMLTVSITLLLASVAITATYFAALSLYDSGYLTPPTSVAASGAR
jgi:hypothetical protein